MISSIPDSCKFTVTLPEARSIFDEGTVSATLSNGKTRDFKVVKKYEKETLSFILGGPFGFDITSSYERGGAIGKTVSSVISGLNSSLSEFGGGLISQRSAVLTYKGSNISGLRLPFVLINSKSETNFLKSHLDPLYRAVLPTLGTTGDFSVDNKGVVDALGNALARFGAYDSYNEIKNKLDDSGGISTKLIGSVGTQLNNVSKTLNSYLGFYGFTAPLSYNPWNVGDVSTPGKSVSLKIGNYFNIPGGLVITGVKVEFSQSEVSLGDSKKAPLYATGSIEFQFVKLISHREFRSYFSEIEDNAVIRAVSNQGEEYTGTTQDYYQSLLKDGNYVFK